MIMKQSKIKVEKIDPESITVFGLPLRITPEIRDTTFRLSKTNPEKYAAIKKSIAAANGKLDEPIKVMKLGSETGDYYTIVDGHTRFEILMDLNILPPDANFVDVSKDVKCVADAQALAYRLNDLRRQAEIYQQAVNAIKANPTLSDRDIADICGIDHVSISRSRSIWTVSRETQNKTDTELTTIQEIVSEVESGTKGIKPVYEQFKVAVEVSNAILEINEPEFAKEMTTFWEAKKYTDKSAAKKLATMIAEHQVGKPDAYSTAIKPVMDKIVKLKVCI